jgi:hypothetical protein
MTLQLIRPPRNLWDAFAQSIIVPLVANARNELAMFEYPGSAEPIAVRMIEKTYSVIAPQSRSSRAASYR